MQINLFDNCMTTNSRSISKMPAILCFDRINPKRISLNWKMLLITFTTCIKCNIISGDIKCPYIVFIGETTTPMLLLGDDDILLIIKHCFVDYPLLFCFQCNVFINAKLRLLFGILFLLDLVKILPSKRLS